MRFTMSGEAAAVPQRGGGGGGIGKWVAAALANRAMRLCTFEIARTAAHQCS